MRETTIGGETAAETTSGLPLARAAIWPFAIAIFLGAFLLFQVQPIIARYILPWFGGAPGVWTACMLFFQVLLLGGYAYAHFSIQKLSPRMQAGVHLTLLGVCVLLLNVTPGATWKPHTASEIANPTWRIVALLAVHVGLPFFALSATGPLLQAWVSRINGGRAPYRLYALSNLGSLLALVSYPFVFEPWLGRTMQADAWSWGMRMFAVACAGCAVLAWRARNAVGKDGVNSLEVPSAEHAQRGPSPAGHGTPKSRPHWLLWFLLPACASVLLLATTNKICQDIAVVPFLWVLPLALYLLSFVLTFDSERWYWRRIYMILLAIGLLCALRIAFKDEDIAWLGRCELFFGIHSGWLTRWEEHCGIQSDGLMAQLVVYASLLFVACMIFHGELVRLKPAARQLTGFYLMIAAGGAAGGMFVAVVAPLIFADYHEYHIGLLACCLILPVTLYLDKSSPFHGRWMRFAWHVLAGLLVALALTLQVHSLAASSKSLVARYRSFYGVLSVFEYGKDDPLGHNFVLQHGQITHGLQFVDPSRNREPTTYYEQGSGVGLAITQLAGKGPRHIGVVGLGTGTVAAYGRTGDRIRYYEINPQVEMIARKHFTYLGLCPGKVDVILGDARLSMEAEPPQAFDVLVLDAFSGDAIPVHLLTREAIEIYLRHMKDNGVIAIHVTNRYLDLEPIAARLAERFDLHAVTVSYDRTEYPSDWVLVTRHRAILDALDEDPSSIHPAQAKKAPLWTDDHTSLLPILQ